MPTQLNVEGAGRRDLAAFPPEALIIDGLDNDNPISPYQKQRISEPLDEDLIASLDAVGNHTSLVIEQRKRGSKEEMDGEYGVVTGTQRTRAARELNKRRAKTGRPPLLLICTVRTDLTAEKRFEIMMSENSLRKDVEEATLAEMAHWLINENNYPVEMVARVCRRTPQTIQTWLADHGFIPEVQAALAEKVIEKTAARELSKHAPEKQKAILAKTREKASRKKGAKRAGKVSVRDVKIAARGGNEIPSEKRVKSVLRRRIPEHAAEAINWLKGWGPEPAWAADLAS